ncbi:hypothetical protein MC28_D052 (plasmid) [Bacillus thuringiensis MC28]|nr:hypothetical protein MC28_D052 [Bacillus thuringiensis MC28]
MGDYTAFRGKVIIKEEYKDLVELINNGDWETANNKYPFLNEYYELERSTLIPFSKEIIQDRLQDEIMSGKGELDLETDPYNWKTDDEYYTDLKGLQWTFITCLKNYEDKDQFYKKPIATFIDVVLLNIVSKVIKLEEYNYEKSDKPIEYDFIKLVNRKEFLNSNLSYWNVTEVNNDTLLVSLKENIHVGNKLVLYIYKFKIGGNNIQIPISSLQARLYLDRFTFIRENRDEFLLGGMYFDETKVDFKQFAIPFPYEGLLECDFSKGIMFKCKTEKDKIKLLKILEKAYAKFFKRFRGSKLILNKRWE